MSIPFNMDEVYEMAEQMERNGQAYYRRASEKVADSAPRKVLVDLAEMEADHEKTFAAMRAATAKQLKPPPSFDPYGEASQYLHAFISGLVFDLDARPEDLLADCEDLQEILRKAIGMERDSIAFYLGIKEMVPPEQGRDKIEDIVREEMGHVAMLSSRIKAMA